MFTVNLEMEMTRLETLELVGIGIYYHSHLGRCDYGYVLRKNWIIFRRSHESPRARTNEVEKSLWSKVKGRAT